MPFVIHSAGNLATSRVRTVTARSTLLVIGLLLTLTLAAGVTGGIVLGARLAGRDAGSPSAIDPARPFDPARPDNRALIDRIGSLSARLLRLESEAEALGSRVGLMADEPSGGPLLDPLEAPDVDLQPDIRARLDSIESGLDDVDAALFRVSRRTQASDVAGMAFPSRYPIAGAHISSGFGNRRDPFTGRLARHPGVDMPAPMGTPILASAGGTVRFAGARRAYGNAVEIDHGDGLVTRYGHASRVLVHAGQVVLPGQAIAMVGSTGRSTGPHLHFEVIRNGHQVQPLRYLEPPSQ